MDMMIEDRLRYRRRVVEMRTSNRGATSTTSTTAATTTAANDVLRHATLRGHGMGLLNL